MSHRSSSLYEMIFKYLRDHVNIHPANIMSDFERAMRKGAKNVWKLCVLNGCVFHYRQALSRRSRVEKKLSDKLSKSLNARRVLRLYMNIIFLPVHLIDEGLMVIRQFQKNHKLAKCFKSFNTYFCKNWLKKLNFCSRDLDLLTNNVCEGFNSKLKKIIISNPSTYTFLGEYEN